MVVAWTLNLFTKWDLSFSEPRTSKGSTHLLFLLSATLAYLFKALESFRSPLFLCCEGYVGSSHALAEPSKVFWRQHSTMLKEMEQRGYWSKLSQLQGQIQRQMLGLFQNKTIPQLYRKISILFPTFLSYLGFLSAEGTKDFFSQRSQEPCLTTLPSLLKGLSFSPFAFRASLKQVCLVQYVEVGCQNWS